ncbi:MAG: enhanced intracellular survival protein Eis [Spirulinaceae cyanobacterium]
MRPWLGNAIALKPRYHQHYTLSFNIMQNPHPPIGAKSMFEVTPLHSENDSQRLGEILCQCFNFAREKVPAYLEGIGIENFRVVRSNQGVLGGLAIYNMAQYFGGKAIPTGGVAAVGIAPEYRGQGAAKVLLRAILQELYAKNVPLSTLYPATQRLYRAVGYEQAGMRCLWQIPLADLALRDRICSVYYLEKPDIFKLNKIYQQLAPRFDGYLHRHLFLWARILHEEAPFYAYELREGEIPVGYIIYQQDRSEAGLTLQIRDWVALTPGALQTLWTLISDYRSQVDYCRWYGGTIEPRLLCLPEQTAEIRESDTWFLRVVNVPQALMLRGYPDGIEGELYFEVQDDVIPQNEGKWVLRLSQGTATVEKSDRADLSFNSRGMAALYAGLYSAQQLAATGLIAGTEKAIQWANTLFRANCPNMPDFF